MEDKPLSLEQRVKIAGCLRLAAFLDGCTDTTTASLLRLAMQSERHYMRLSEQLANALRSWKLVPRPWMNGIPISWPEWDAAITKIETVLAKYDAVATLRGEGGE